MNPQSADQVNATRFWVCCRAILVVLALLSGHAVMSESEAADQVTRTADGATIRGEFTEMTKESVTIQTSGGKKETVSVADIRNLQFDQEPPFWRRREAMSEVAFLMRPSKSMNRFDLKVTRRNAAFERRSIF
jgi:hypothetical protein